MNKLHLPSVETSHSPPAVAAVIAQRCFGTARSARRDAAHVVIPDACAEVRR